MADDASNAPSEASKVQPKKETVRINLPPKPTAAPTVKIPAPAPAAAGAAKAAPASAGATQKLPAAAPLAPKAPAAPKAGGAPRPAPAMTPRAKKSVPTISGADKGLAIAAVVVSVAVVVQLFLLGG